MLNQEVIEIHSMVSDSGLRKPNVENINKINNSIELYKNSEFDNFEKLVRMAVYPAALVKLYQPFYDGNHKAALVLFGRLLELKGYSFDFKNAIKDMNSRELNINTLYSSDDEIVDVSRYYKYIDREKSVNDSNKNNLL